MSAKMRRREFIALLVGAAIAWPRVVRGQFKPAIIGVLGSGSPQSSAFLIDALKEGMNGNGVIVTTIAAARAAQQVAPATPIVMTGLIDPVGVGLIASLARPGNNTTGISNMIQDTSAKGLELIREVAPTAKAIATLFNPNNPGSRLILEDVRSQAAKLGMTIQPIEFKGSAVLDATLEAAAGRDALLVVADSTLLDLRERIAELALRHRLPTFSSIPEFTDAGALVGYGPSRRDSYRRAATYVKKVLEGAKPADIPVEQPTLIELSINMQTARALDIVIPDALFARAERVIE
jgi:ABC-type uncharacterized transport system substrate-binding protein